jgi:hypothetical protein
MEEINLKFRESKKIEKINKEIQELRYELSSANHEKNEEENLKETNDFMINLDKLLLKFKKYYVTKKDSEVNLGNIKIYLRQISL